MVKLIGYDNSPVSNYAVYPITSIDQNISLMAQVAIQSLDNYIPCETIVPAILVKKNTTLWYLTLNYSLLFREWFRVKY